MPPAPRALRAGRAAWRARRRRGGHPRAERRPGPVGEAIYLAFRARAPSERWVGCRARLSSLPSLIASRNVLPAWASGRLPLSACYVGVKSGNQRNAVLVWVLVLVEDPTRMRSDIVSWVVPDAGEQVRYVRGGW